MKGIIIGMLKAEIDNRTVGKADNYRTVIYEEIRLSTFNGVDISQLLSFVFLFCLASKV